MALTEKQKLARQHRRQLDRLGPEAFVGTRDAADIIGISHPNLNRDFVKTGRLKVAARVQAGAIYLRSECEAIREELDAERKAKDV